MSDIPWVDALLRCFPGQRPGCAELYWLLLSPLRLPTQCYRAGKKGTVSAFRDDSVRAGQARLLSIARETMERAAEHARRAGRRPAPTENLLPNVCPGEQPKLDQAVSCLKDALADWWKGESRAPFPKNSVGAEIFEQSRHRFLAWFAQPDWAEAMERAEDYYASALRVILLEVDEDAPAPLAQALCVRLADLLKDSLWSEMESLPREPVRRAARLLLAVLFRGLYTQYRFDSEPEEIQAQLQAAAEDLGFSRPGRQTPADEVSAAVDVLRLQDLCRFLLTRILYNTPEDAADLCYCIEQVLLLLKVGPEGSALRLLDEHSAQGSGRVRFDLWMRDADRLLSEHIRRLSEDYWAALNSQQPTEEIKALKKRASKLSADLQDLI